MTEFIQAPPSFTGFCWQYFLIEFVKPREKIKNVKCKLCYTVISYAYNTLNANKHLRAKHGIFFKEIKR